MGFLVVVKGEGEGVCSGSSIFTLWVFLLGGKVTIGSSEISGFRIYRPADGLASVSGSFC